MAATMSSQSFTSIPTKLVRTRRSHNKVRSGCSTCKMRRKKCDEGKPCCQRCTTSGWKCDGYASVVTPNTAAWEVHTDNPAVTKSKPKPSKKVLVAETAIVRKKAPLNLSWTMEKPSSNQVLTTQIELSCFDYFKFITGPQISAYHDSSMWRDFVIRASLLHPVVMKAAAAVGAAHRRFDLGISKEAFEYCAISDRLFKEAKHSLKCFKQDVDLCQHAAEVNAAVEFLHGAYELFQDNHQEAACRMSEGLKTLWNKPFYTLHSESRYQHVNAGPGFFPGLVAKLENYATQVLSRKPQILSDYSMQPLPSMPTRFASLEEGLDLLFTQIHYVLHTPVLIWREEELKKELQASHVHALLGWNSAFAETIEVMGDRTHSQVRACLYLRRVRNMTYLLLYLVFFVRDDKHPCQQFQNSLNAKLLSDRAGLEQDFVHNHHCPIELEGCANGSSVSLQDSLDSLVIENHDLWQLINSHEDLTTNISRVKLAIDELLDPASKFEHYPYIMSINMDTGIGPPRSSSPGPNASAKTRHLVRSLLDPESRERLHQHSFALTSQENHGTSIASSTVQICEYDSCASGPVLQSKAYGIAEQLCSIEEHAIYAAVKQSIIVPRDLKPVWLDVSCFLEERKMLLRYCSRDNGVKAGAASGMIWTQEWVGF